MKLVEAVRLVAKDTHASTGKFPSDTAAIACARKELTMDDLSVVDSPKLKQAYVLVLKASDKDIAKALGAQ